MLGKPAFSATPELLRLASLLLYQGLLLAPTLGIGAFVFPRMLGGDFGGARSPSEQRGKLGRALAAAALLVVSFFLEAYGQARLGISLRLVVMGLYLALEVRWFQHPSETQVQGTLVKGLFWSLGSGAAGLALAAVFRLQNVSVMHLLYVGGFGLLMLVVGSRVLFGHSGELAGFHQRSWTARSLIFLALLAAATRVTTGFLPHLTVTHHIYAALTWAVVATWWLVWHGRRFRKRDEEGNA
jgi:uncharacterized protein involved in response to NO